MSKIKVTNLVKFYTLLLLSSGPKHGYELIKELEEHMDKKISTSHVYPFLNTLKGNKIIEIKEKEERDKKVYVLTSKGKKFVKTMLNRFGDLIDIAVKPRLTVCAHCGCEIYKGGVEEKVKGKKLAFCCHHCAGSYKKSHS